LRFYYSFKNTELFSTTATRGCHHPVLFCFFLFWYITASLHAGCQTLSTEQILSKHVKQQTAEVLAKIRIRVAELLRFVGKYKMVAAAILYFVFVKYNDRTPCRMANSVYNTNSVQIHATVAELKLKKVKVKLRYIIVRSKA